MTSAATLRRTMVVALCALLIAAMGAAPADAKKKKKKKKPPVPACPVFTPAEPDSESGETAEALEAEIQMVTAAHTEEAPLVIEYEHGPAFWETVTRTAVMEDTMFFNIQVDNPAAPTSGLYIRQEWPSPSLSDMDLYLYDSSGAEVEASGAFNQTPVPLPLGGFETGAMGYESISGFVAGQCSGYTIESRAFTTLGESMTLKVWLGEIAG